MASRRGRKTDPFEVIGGYIAMLIVCMFLPIGWALKAHLLLWGVLIIGLAAGIKYGPQYLAGQRYKALQLDDVDRMSGREFEQYVACLLQHQGYRTTLTPTSGDLGVDIVAERGGVRCAIQCKRWSRQVPRTAVSDAVAGAAHYRCTESMVVTTALFTPGAIQLARANKCGLVDRDLLAQWVGQYQATTPTPAGLSKRT